MPFAPDDVWVKGDGKQFCDGSPSARPPAMMSDARSDHILNRAAWRLIPFMALMYVVSFLDRTNISFAALTMNRDLGFSPEIYGRGAGIFFWGYFLFEIPSNLMLVRLGNEVTARTPGMPRMPPRFASVNFTLRHLGPLTFLSRP